MIVLGALPDWILTLVWKTYAKALSEHHFRICGRAAPAPLRNLQSLSFLPHLLGVSGSWKNIQVYNFICSYVNKEVPIYRTLEEFCDEFLDLWRTAQISTVFEEHTRILYDYRIMVRQNLLVSLRHVVSWNISCWHPLYTGRDPKLITIRKHLKKGPVRLQETKWTDAMAIGLQQRLPAVRVIRTSAIPTEQGGLSGGTAILIPTSLEVVEIQEVVKGRILGVLVSSRTSKFGSTLSIFILLAKLMSFRPSDNFFTLHHVLRRRQLLLATLIMQTRNYQKIGIKSPILGVETTVKGRTTYYCHRGEFSLDDVLVPSDYIQNNLTTCCGLRFL